MLRFFSALAILALALFLQFFLAGVGLYFNLALAVLIAFAFILDFWEFAIADLIAVFILNWQPAPSVALIAFALIPLIAFAFRKLVRSEAWIGLSIAILFGFLMFYLAAAPAQFVPDFAIFLGDVAVGLVVGELVLVAL